MSVGKLVFNFQLETHQKKKQLSNCLSNMFPSCSRFLTFCAPFWKSHETLKFGAEKNHQKSLAETLLLRFRQPTSRYIHSSAWSINQPKSTSLWRTSDHRRRRVSAEFYSFVLGEFGLLFCEFFNPLDFFVLL